MEIEFVKVEAVYRVKYKGFLYEITETRDEDDTPIDWQVTIRGLSVRSDLRIEIVAAFLEEQNSRIYKSL